MTLGAGKLARVAATAGRSGSLLASPALLGSYLFNNRIFRKKRNNLPIGSKERAVYRVTRFVEKHPFAVMMAASSPLLLQEGAATAFALKRLAQKYGIRSTKFMNGLKELGTGGLTYLLATLGLSLGSWIFYRTMRKGHKYEPIYRKEMGFKKMFVSPYFVTKLEKIIKPVGGGKYVVFSEKKDKHGKRKRLSKPLSLKAAKKRLAQIEYFKRVKG